MAASSADFFTKVGNPGTATTLAAPGHTSGGTSITVVSTSNWPTDTGVIFAIDTVSLVDGVEVRDVGSYTEWEGEVTSATAISNMVLRYGSDQNYPAGATTRVYIPVASSEVNRSVDGILVNHTQTGSHKTLTDGNGNEWLELGTTASAVNHPKVTNAATGNNPLIEAVGGDTNIGLDVSSKGTGGITAWAGAKTRELLKLLNVASAVNEVTISPSATGNPVQVEATGDDTNVGIKVLPKGTGKIDLAGPTTNKYCFRAYKDANQNVTDATLTKIVFETEAYDYNNNFASSTYTAPVAGVYHFDAQVQHLNASVSPADAFIRIYVNGSGVVTGHRNPGSTTGDNAWSVSADILLAAGDTVEIYHFQDSSGTEAVAGGNTGLQSWFNGHLVHAT